MLLDTTQVFMSLVVTTLDSLENIPLSHKLNSSALDEPGDL